jgi:histidyl-tRNA synthetase
MNHNQLTFPFKRYQIQPVWRADNPQRGRYREFTQCDADVVGSRSLINEIELVNIYHTVFMQLGLKGYELRINSRKILTALAESCGGADQMINITIAIDKLDKIGLDGVKKELIERGLNDTQISFIERYLSIGGSNEDKLRSIETLLGNTEAAKAGIEELRTVTEAANLQELIIDLTLARGLNYYTGVIFEAKAPPQVKMGSIGGGGRYDDLTGLFGVPNIPGIGISFGVDRIYDVLEEMNHFPPDVQVGTQVLLFNLGEAESKAAYKLMQELRQAGIRSELFHENTKFDKQFKYAEKKGIPYAIIIGSQELAAGEAVIKDLRKGTQIKATMSDAACYVFE